MKFLFRLLYQCLMVSTLLSSCYFAAYEMRSYWLALLLIAGAHLLQMIVPYDKSAVGAQPPVSKIKLPLVTLPVMLGSAWLLATVPQTGLALWLGLAGIAGFIINNYWVES